MIFFNLEIRFSLKTNFYQKIDWEFLRKLFACKCSKKSAQPIKASSFWSEAYTRLSRKAASEKKADSNFVRAQDRKTAITGRLLWLSNKNNKSIEDRFFSIRNKKNSKKGCQFPSLNTDINKVEKTKTIKRTHGKHKQSTNVYFFLGELKSKITQT